MAEERRANLLSSAFPAPPPFYKYFTAENQTRLKAAQDQAAAKSSQARAGTSQEEHEDPQSSKDTQTDLQHLDLPRELLYLIPPVLPSDGVYRSFGETFDISNPLPSLRSRGIEQLYPTPPSSPPPPPFTISPTTSSLSFRQNELIKIMRSTLLLFLELTGTLSLDASLATPKLADLRILFLNAHHLINEYRPHQARETVIEMVAEQLRSRREEIEGVKRMKEKVDELLKGLGEGSKGVKEKKRAENGDDLGGTEQQAGEEQRMRAVWAALDEVEI